MHRFESDRRLQLFSLGAVRF